MVHFIGPYLLYTDATTNKEVNTMKPKKNYPHLSVYHAQPAYPNAADQNYFIRKILDIVMGLVSGIGLVTAMIALIALT